MPEQHLFPVPERHILHRPEVEVKVGFKRACLHERVKAGKFPKPIVLGIRAVGWDSIEIDQWILDRRLSPLLIGTHESLIPRLGDEGTLKLFRLARLARRLRDIEAEAASDLPEP
jgi:prophage regulatory protein